MAKLIYIFLIPWCLFAYASHAQAYANFPHDSTLEVFSKKGKKGIRNESGNILLDAKYQAFGWSDGESKSLTGYIGYQQNDLWGLMSNDFEVISKPKYHSLLPFGDDLFIISEKSKYSKVLFYGLIKANGKSKIKTSFRNIYPAGNHLITATKKEKDIYFGIINSSGKTTLPFEYFHIGYLGHDNFILTKNTGEKELIKLASKPEVLLGNMDSVSSFRDGVAIIFRNGKQGLIRQDGKMLLPIEYKKIEWNNGTHIYVTPLDEWTILNQNGRETGIQKADSIFYLNDSLLVKNTSSFAQIHNINTNKSNQVFHADIIGVFGDHFILNKSNQTFIAQDSNQIISEKFNNDVQWNEDFFVAKKKTYQGFENIIISTKGKSIKADSYMFLDNSIALKIKANWGIFDKNLKEVIPPLYLNILRNENQYIVNFKGLYGVIDLNNNWVIPPQYKEIKAINSTQYKLVDKYLREFISDGDGNTEARLYYDFYGNYGVEQDLNDKYRLVDHKGQAISDFKKGKYSGHGKSGIIFRNGNQHILLNDSGKELFKINDYDTIIFSDDEYLAIQKNGQWGFINDSGILRIANRYDTVRPFKNERSAVKIRNSWGFINRSEDLVVQPYYSKVSDFENSTAFVRINNKYGLINVNGDFIIEAEYDEILKEKGFYLLRKASKWGIANTQGEVISYPNYDEITVGNDYLKVEKYGTSRILSKKGTNLIDNQYDQIYYDEERKLFLAKKKSKKEQVFLTDILSGDYP
ncbi:WG repeat-containing protein [Marivirga salinae]|uniref:WG repeat-containing protein n=1 Tax=Marivirga salinarum TaxID=3059078 RepID=A0AA51REL8_9BACT|nr:WG repeat-containing protein [Marivirga sp. BDSF4-3]WMN11910.1 WG repeat-containing protein [Marivirga sp. BDSF4-3]